MAAAQKKSHEEHINSIQGEVNTNPEYLRCVAQTASETAMIAQQDIYATNGMKLLSAGSRVEPGWWEKLAQHKLATPVESALVATEMLDAVWLAQDVDQMLATEPVVMALINRTGDPQAWKAAIGSLYAPQPLLFRLTVMRAQKTEMYRHALRLAVIAHAIGVEMLRSTQELSDLFLTALCHDLGEMHTDPSILTDGQAITGKDLRFIHVHPITGYVILRQISGISPYVAQAVMQHHERLDGSGYPHGISGAKIHFLARVLSVAELFDAVARRGGVERLEVVLKVDQAQFDAAAVRALRKLLPTANVVVPAPTDAGHPPLMPRLQRLLLLEQSWGALKSRLETSPVDEATTFIHDRVTQLQLVAWRAGIAPGFMEFFQPEAADAQSIHEVHVTLDELDRLFMAFSTEIQRRIDRSSRNWNDLIEFCKKLRSEESAALGPVSDVNHH